MAKSRLDTKYPPPIYSSLLLEDNRWDQLSAILSDYLMFARLHQQSLEQAKCFAAGELTAKWMSQAADLRDIIEARD